MLQHSAFAYIGGLLQVKVDHRSSAVILVECVNWYPEWCSGSFLTVLYSLLCSRLEWLIVAWLGMGSGGQLSDNSETIPLVDSRLFVRRFLQSAFKKLLKIYVIVGD